MINYNRRIGLESHEKPAYGTVISNPFHPLSQGLVGRWMFNEGGGNTVYDISGQGNHGTLMNGTGWGGSKFGGGVQFDGVDDYVDCGNAVNFTSEDFTLSTWIYINSLPLSGTASTPVLFYKGGYNINGYYLQLDYGAAHHNGGFKFHTNQSGATQITYSDASILSIGQWIHITAVRSGSNVDLYLNGRDVTNTHATHTNPASSSNNFLISSYNNSGYYLDGSIDSVLIYNRALSAEEIKTLYHNPFCNLIRVPVHRYSVAAAPPPSAIMNQFQKANIGADLYNGAIIA